MSLNRVGIHHQTYHRVGQTGLAVPQAGCGQAVAVTAVTAVTAVPLTTARSDQSLISHGDLVTAKSVMVTLLPVLHMLQDRPEVFQAASSAGLQSRDPGSRGALPPATACFI